MENENIPSVAPVIVKSGTHEARLLPRKCECGEPFRGFERQRYRNENDGRYYDWFVMTCSKCGLRKEALMDISRFFNRTKFLIILALSSLLVILGLVALIFFEREDEGSMLAMTILASAAVLISIWRLRSIKTKAHNNLTK